MEVVSARDTGIEDFRYHPKTAENSWFHLVAEHPSTIKSMPN
jgi:hypothetical protein